MPSALAPVALSVLLGAASAQSVSWLMDDTSYNFTYVPNVFQILGHTCSDARVGTFSDVIATPSGKFVFTPMHGHAIGVLEPAKSKCAGSCPEPPVPQSDMPSRSAPPQIHPLPASCPRQARDDVCATEPSNQV